MTTEVLGNKVITHPYSDYTLNVTWIIAAVLYILAGVLAIFPAAMDLFGGKKKRK